AGKSNVVSFFKMLNEMMAGRLQQFVAMSGRAQSILHFGPKVTPQLESTLEFEGENLAGENMVDVYRMRLFHAANDSLVFADEVLEYKKEDWQTLNRQSLGAGHQETRIEDLAAQGNSAAKVFRHILNNCRVYHFHDTSPTARVRQFGYIGDNRWLMPDAGNLAALLYSYRQKDEPVYRRIVSTIKKVMPDFADFDLEPDRVNPRDIQLNWRKSGQDYLFGPHQVSDGTLRAMAIITLFLQPDADLPDVIILDEPELGLHPHAIEIIAGLIRAASVKSQVIVATQSLTFLGQFEPSEIVVVEATAGSSDLRRLNAEHLKDWLVDYSIGELWEKNVLGGSPLQ
ncbi:MAG: AAA family ATPase, partial [Tepidisphaeraceae bacterium]